MTFVSICIPRMESKHTVEFIRKAFEKVNIGNILDIVEIHNKNNDKYKKVILNVDLTDNTDIINRRFTEGKDIKLIYDSPWYWKIYKTK